MKNILVTGGAGFIGSNFVHYLLQKNDQFRVINLDKLTYAANLRNLDGLNTDRHHFVEGDIADSNLVTRLMEKYSIKYVMNFAAESHVDNSISGPEVFLDSNVYGTFNLLRVASKNWMKSPGKFNQGFEDSRFIQISTDEVFGSLPSGIRAHENYVYNPGNPYSASKASADMLVKSYFNTFGLPILISRCSNNYGKHQHQEKFIPKILQCLIKGERVPIYGDGKNVREWLFVEDHCRAIYKILIDGRIGESYNIGEDIETSNIDLVIKIVELFAEISPELRLFERENIKYVQDRPGHDRRYSLDSSKIRKELGWIPKTSLSDGLRRTIKWYMKKEIGRT